MTYIHERCMELVEKARQAVSRSDNDLRSATHLLMLNQLIRTQNPSYHSSIVIQQAQKDMVRAQKQGYTAINAMDRAGEVWECRNSYLRQCTSTKSRTAGGKTMAIREALCAVRTSQPELSGKDLRDEVWEYLDVNYEELSLSLSNEKIQRVIRDELKKQKVPSVD